MQFHRLATFIIGIWLGIIVFMDFAATENFRTVNRVMTSLDVRVVENAKKLGDPDNARYLLRYFAGEANRYLFEQWEWAELGLGLALLLVLLFARSYQKLAMGLCIAMITIVLVQRFKLTPMIVTIGRELEFSSGASRRFAAVHQVYGYVEIGKLLLGIGIALKLLIRERAGKRAFVREYEREELMRSRKG